MNWPKYPRVTWSGLVNKPGWLSTFDGTWAGLAGKPIFATVATTGAYSDLSGLPNLSLYATTAALTAGLATKFTTPSGTASQVVLGNGTLGTLPTNYVIQRIRAQTNTSGVYTWTFAAGFAANPILSVTVEDNTSAMWNHQITALSPTSATIQITKTNAVTILGISVLGIAANPQAFVHLSAIAP